MSSRRIASRVANLLKHPRTTVRWRLTLLYSALFLLSGATLLAITYSFVARNIGAGGQVFASDVSVSPGRVAPGRGAALPLHGASANRQAAANGPPPSFRALVQTPAGRATVRFVGTGQRTADLHQLLVVSGIALAIMVVLSAVLGWVVAGRVLAPLRTMMTTTQEISEANLHRRLAMPGARDELTELADTIDGLLARLQAAFDAQKQFVANASHELRTPLTAARALLELALTDPHATVETFRQTSRQALEESQRQERLIDALLVLARGQRGLAQQEWVDLGEIVRAALTALCPEVSKRGLHLDVSLQPACCVGDARLIERLVLNLLENAVRHNAPGGNVRISLDVHSAQATLAIANTGSPVPASELERLRQPFQRLAGNRVGHHEGLGLGLSIVAAIADAHNAALDIQPGAQGGLEVEVRFAAVPAQSTTPTAPLTSGHSPGKARETAVLRRVGA